MGKKTLFRAGKDLYEVREIKIDNDRGRIVKGVGEFFSKKEAMSIIRKSRR